MVTSGLRTLPMVVGMLVTSTGSGVVVGRTGRYKIFPVTGTALMAVPFVLMSRMDATTPAVVQSPYLLVLGAGIGFSMQVPVFVVQCTSDFEDPGVATSGVTFFRTIGGSFGAAVLGSLFVNFLPDRLGPALASNGSSAESVNSPEALHRQPLAEGHLSCRPTPNHWARFSLGRNGCRRRFRPGAVLREAPPRDIHNSAVDLGDGFGMPTTETPETLLENGDRPDVARRSRYATAQHRHASRLPARRRRSMGIAAHQPLSAILRRGPIGNHLGSPFEVVEPTFSRWLPTDMWRTTTITCR